jgi:4-hydroxyacetophenone monooxygenase
MPMAVTGTGGVDLHERWGGEARAFLGLTIPGFPNLFVLYGPNTNLVVNGSIFFMSECGANFVVEAVRRLAGTPGARTVEVTPAAYEAFGREVDEEHTHLVWAVADVNTWYRNANGRATQTWPFSLVEYWRRTRGPDPDDYVVA